MPLLRLLCPRGIGSLQKQTLVFPAGLFGRVEVRKNSSRGLKSVSKNVVQTTAKELHDHVDDHDPERFNRRSAANFDTIGSWNTRVQMKLNMEQSIKFGRLIPEVSLDAVGVVTLLGRRKENEDRYKIVRLAPNLLMFAIFDGHGGPKAADYTSDRMSKFIKFWLERGETNLQIVLKKAFVGVDNAFSQHLQHISLEADSTRQSGTTATVCLLRNNVELVVGWVGDSRALMCRRGKVVRLMHDHKPRDPVERQRIEKAGGVIVEPTGGTPRVAGKLDMTRSIGDVELKAVGVTAEPDTRSIEVSHGKDAFLVLSTDGVNYVMNDQEIIDIICTCDSASEAVRSIGDQALHYGSEDNCTAIVIPFGAWGKYAQSASTVQFSFGRNIIGRRYS